MNHHLPLRNKIIIMVSVMASLFLVALDQTIISTALGRIVEEFNAFDSLSWIVTAYLLTTTITVPLAGKLSDLFGRRVILLIGVAIFGLGSLMSGLAGDVNQLVLWRAFQGIGGGIITANAFTIIGDLFESRERGRWQGMIGAVFGLASLVGPLLGGWLTDGQNVFGAMTDWRWTFYLNVPIAVAAFAVIAIFCPALMHAKKPKIDYIGAALMTFGLATLVLAVDNTEAIFSDVMNVFSLSLTALRVIMFSLVAFTVAAFVWYERRAIEPVLPLRFFSNRVYSLIMIVATLFGAGFLGSILYLTQFNQQVFGASPTASGLMLLPMVGGLMVASIGSGQIISRTGRYKSFMVVGIVLATIMVGLLATLTPDSSFAYEAVLTTLLGFGLGLVMPVMNIAVQNEFKQQELGAATSSIQLFRGLGSTIGIALFGALLTTGLTTELATAKDDQYLTSLQRSPEAKKIGSFDDSNTLLTLNSPDVRKKINAGFARSVEDLPVQQRQEATKAFHASQAAYSDKVVNAFSESLRTIFLIAAALMAVGAVVVIGLPKRELSHSHTTSLVEG